MIDLDPRLRDFRNFLYLVWDHLGLPEPTPIQYDIAHYLATGGERSGVEAFRGVGKSWMTSALACHTLLLNPEEKVLVSSANSKRAKAFTTFTRRLIEEMPLLRHLRPRDGQRDSVEGFDVGPATNAQSASVAAFGITSQLTGSRASLIIGDDIEIPSNSDTVAKRENLAEAVKEFDSVLMPGGRIVYLGTPQTEESIYNKVLIPRGYRFRIWPARVPTKAKAEKYGDALAPMITRMMDEGVKAGTPTEPSRFGDYELSKRELSIGRSTFALQFQLDTSLSDAERYPLRCADFAVFPSAGPMGPVKLSWASSPELTIQDLPVKGFSGDRWYRPIFVAPEFQEWHGVTMSIDPSGRGKDELAYAIVKMLNGNLFLAGAGGMVGGYTEANLTRLANLAKAQKVKHIRIESNFGDGMFTALFQPVLAKVYPCTVEEVRHNVQKEKRIIDTLEPVLNQHRLFIDAEVIRRDAENYNDHPEESASQYSLIHQLTHITRDKGSLVHDDRLDALAMAVAYWVEQMTKDDTLAQKEYRAKAMDKEIEEYFDALGRADLLGPRGDSMVNLIHRDGL